MLQAKQAHRLAPYGELTLRQLFLSLFNSLLLPLCLSISAFSSVCIVGQLDLFIRRNLPGTWRGGKGGLHFDGKPVSDFKVLIVIVQSENVFVFCFFLPPIFLKHFSAESVVRLVNNPTSPQILVQAWSLRALCGKVGRIQCSHLPPIILQCCNTIQYNSSHLESCNRAICQKWNQWRWLSARPRWERPLLWERPL